MMRRTSAVGVLVAVAVALVACAGAPAGVDSISPDELAARLEAGDAPLILDVRTPGEYAAGHIPGAINIPHTELAARIGEVEPWRDREVVVHCKSGRRAAVAEEVLRDAGFGRVRDLEGHIQVWESDGYPTE